MMSLPPNLKPATWGCAHGSGFLGTAIREAEMGMSRTKRFPGGDREASWAGHCVIYVGNYDFGTPGHPDVEPAIVEAEWPKVIVSRASKHQFVIWASNQLLTDAQRTEGVKAAFNMVGMNYDILAYGWFIARFLQLKFTNNLAPLFTDPRLVLCSGTVVKEQISMLVDVTKLVTATVPNPDFVCPADCMRWGLDNSWMSETPPDW